MTATTGFISIHSDYPEHKFINQNDRNRFVILDMAACVAAQDIFIGKSLSTLSKHVVAWREFLYQRRSVYVKGICETQWQVDKAKKEAFRCQTEDLEYYQRFMQSKEVGSKSPSSSSCTPCEAPLAFT